jgi:hypothetical protein
MSRCGSPPILEVGKRRCPARQRSPVKGATELAEEPVTLLKSRNYKCCISVGVSRHILTPVRAVLDTGAGPNLIREDLLPRNWELVRIPGLFLPLFTNASGCRIPARGVVQLYVQIGDAIKQVRFYVTPGLAVPCILGCNFINLQVKAILPKEQKVILQEGGTVPIAPGIGKEECGTTDFSDTKSPPPQFKLRLARKVMLPPRCGEHVMVESAGSFLCFLQNSVKKCATNGVSLANGVADIRKHYPFKVRVIKTSDRQHNLQKGMILGWTLPHPMQILTVPTDGDRKHGELMGVHRRSSEPPTTVNPRMFLVLTPKTLFNSGNTSWTWATSSPPSGRQSLTC